ncbi:hypothetical protein BB559_002793 [Furculomyces boomerangus]|uniref:Receptor L-domain domain-containing protein n=1 Tax=Furculomyces boomerangus TaxID=61424 RepID=A0A2T9YSK6_9FUNG|nr:hypothetical protein BB559_002793 [Furculomyces boomerangus]
MIKGILSLFLLATPFISAAFCDSDVIVTTQEDAGRVSQCKKFGGSIFVQNKDVNNLDFENLVEVGGSIVISENKKLGKIKLDDLKEVGDSIFFVNNTVLLGISMQKLNKAKQIVLENNPNLVTLYAENISSITSFKVIQTAIHSLTKQNIKNLDNLEISSNPLLATIDFPKLNTCGELILANNNPSAVANFPELSTLKGSTTFRDLLSVNIQNITSIQDTFNIINNFFEDIRIDNISESGKDITVSGNKRLKYFSFSNLENVYGGIQIRNNSVLNSIEDSSFKKLKYVKGAMEISGGLSSIAFPSLNKVDGSINIVSTTKLDCNKIQDKLSGIQSGKFSCASNSAKEPTSSDSSDGNEITSGKSNSASKLLSSSLGLLFAFIISFLFY